MSYTSSPFSPYLEALELQFSLGPFYTFVFLSLMVLYQLESIHLDDYNLIYSQKKNRGSPKEDNAPSSRNSKGTSSNKEGSDKRASRDGSDVDLSKGDSVNILAFPFPLVCVAFLYYGRSPRHSKGVLRPWVELEVHEPQLEQRDLYLPSIVLVVPVQPPRVDSLTLLRS